MVALESSTLKLQFQAGFSASYCDVKKKISYRGNGFPNGGNIEKMNHFKEPPTMWILENQSFKTSHSITFTVALTNIPKSSYLELIQPHKLTALSRVVLVGK